MSARESVARAWHAGSDHAAESPFGGPLCNCEAVADRIIPMLAEAWDEGESDGRQNAIEYREYRKFTNPYEGDQS